jgi:hypothetical protein
MTGQEDLNHARLLRTKVVRYHEAGHAVIGELLGVPLLWTAIIDQGPGSQVLGRTERIPGAFEAASLETRIKTKLAGGLAEEILLGARSPGGTLHDDESIAGLLKELEPDEKGRDAVRSRLEAEVRALLGHLKNRALVEAAAEHLGLWSELTGVGLREIMRTKGMGPPSSAN